MRRASTTVALVGCGKAKRPGRHPARDLYVGPLFRAALEHVEATADRVFILSGRHGLLPLDQVVEAYDTPLPTGQERLDWGVRVVEALVEAVPGRITLTVYAGAAYANEVWCALAGYSDRVRVLQPLRGMSQGKRLGWFRARRERRARCSTAA